VTTTKELVMFSFSQQQIAHFQAFGFVVVRGLLNQAETATLTREVTDAFGGSGPDTDPEGLGGIRGDYLPLSVDRMPLSQSLMADDPRSSTSLGRGSPIRSACGWCTTWSSTRSTSTVRATTVSAGPPGGSGKPAPDRSRRGGSRSSGWGCSGPSARVIHGELPRIT
jgi:hypothetical protein